MSDEPAVDCSADGPAPGGATSRSGLPAVSLGLVAAVRSAEVGMFTTGDVVTIVEFAVMGVVSVGSHP